MSDHPIIPEDELSVWEKPSTQRVLWIVLLIGCLISVAAGFYLAVNHMTHPHFDVDKFPALYAGIGFVCFSLIVLIGQHLRLILMQDEGYYDGDEARRDGEPDEGGPR